MFGVVAYFCPFVFTQKPPPPAAVIDFLCKARIQNFLINSISVRRAVERDCQTRACSNLTLRCEEDMAAIGSATGTDREEQDLDTSCVSLPLMSTTTVPDMPQVAVDLLINHFFPCIG